MLKNVRLLSSKKNRKNESSARPQQVLLEEDTPDHSLRVRSDLYNVTSSGILRVIQCSPVQNLSEKAEVTGTSQCHLTDPELIEIVESSQCRLTDPSLSDDPLIDVVDTSQCSFPDDPLVIKVVASPQRKRALPPEGDTNAEDDTNSPPRRRVRVLLPFVSKSMLQRYSETTLEDAASTVPEDEPFEVLDLDSLDSGSEIDEKSQLVRDTLHLDSLEVEESEPEFEDLDSEYEDEEQELELEESELIEWTSDYSTFSGTREEFREKTGPTVEGTSPLGLFTQIWDSSLMELIVGETNRNARDTNSEARQADTDTPHSRSNDWKETTVSEIYRLFSVIIIMSVCVRGRVEDYWSTGITGMPKFRKLMSKGRYLILMRFLQFADINLVATEDCRIAKIKPLLDYLNRKFKEVYRPEQELSLDESKFGFKTYELCEAATGYVLDLIIHSGKGSTSSEPIQGFTSSTAKNVLRSMDQYMDKGHTLFVDNFDNSVNLTRYLKNKRKTDLVGMLNRQRVGTPEDLKDKRLAKGEVVARHCGDVSVVAWKDLKLVTTVSTYHNADMTIHQRAGKQISVPVVIKDHNKFMGGVDLKYQKLSMYFLERKRLIEWHIKVFKRLLNISIFNAYVCYCANIGQSTKMSHRQFRYNLALELAESHGVDVKVRERQTHGSSVTCRRLVRSLGHFPEQVEVESRATTKNQKFKRFRCAMCIIRKVRKDVNIRCRECKVFLCVGDCWRDYHTLDKL